MSIARNPSRSQDSAATPSHVLTVAQPQVDARLTPCLQLRPYRPPLVSRARRAEHRVSGATWSRCFQPRFPSWRPTSDALCRAPASLDPTKGPSVPKSQRRFRRTLVKRCDFHGAERLPPTSAPKESCFRMPPRIMLSHDPAPSRELRRGTRHQSRGFATTIPASDTSSPPAALAFEG